MSISIREVLVDTYTLPVMVISLKTRSIISIPTQIGCPVKCTFCVSKNSRFIRSLYSEELRCLIENGLENISWKTTVSFTGEWEPLLNIDNINQTIEQISHYDAIDAFRISMSWISAEKLSTVLPCSKPFNLQLSLHSPFDKIRGSLIKHTNPINYILNHIKLNENRFSEIAVNYVLMKGINDSDDDLKELVKIIPKNWVIKLNPLLSDIFVPSDRAEFFEKTLCEEWMSVKRFTKIGSTIKNDFYSYLSYRD